MANPDLRRTRHAIERLCVEAGALMEDASVIAVSSLPADTAGRAAVLSGLSRTGADIAALLSAAEVLERRAGADKD